MAKARIYYTRNEGGNRAKYKFFTDKPEFSKDSCGDGYWASPNGCIEWFDKPYEGLPDLAPDQMITFEQVEDKPARRHK